MAARVSGRMLTLVIVSLFGRWQWQAPAWLAWAGAKGTRGRRYLAAHPARAASLALALVATAGAYFWYASRPRPHYVTYSVSEPDLTEYNDNGIASIKRMTGVFSESAAPLRQLQKTVTAGIELSPAIAGTWFWTSDKELEFTPKDDWPVDGAFSVQFARKGLLANQVVLEQYGFKFRSQPFSARISESQFYQDPRDPNLKKLVATVKFSPPRGCRPSPGARVPRRRQGRCLSGSDARQPALHGGLRQVQAFRLHPFRGTRDAARRHADDPENRQGRAGGSRRERHA
jgi:hypothetical protein